MTAPTEQDRAVASLEALACEISDRSYARSVLRRHPQIGRLWSTDAIVTAAVDGARLGREYAAALRGAP